MANPEALAMLRIARMRAAEPAFRLCAELNANLGGLSAPISELRRRLLALWHENGRHTIPQKVGADGCPAGRWLPRRPMASRWIPSRSGAPR